jgi:MoaA/NifB/PqqE/SkfB family radical SAM enzyme
MQLGLLRAALLALRCPEAWTLPPQLGKALLRSLLRTRPATAATGTILYPNCPPVGSPAFRRHLHGLKRIARGEHVPMAAHISVTDRCIYRCARCSNLSDAPDDPGLEKLSQLVADLKARGMVSVSFTGGEPLLRNDLARLVESCGSDIATAILTSGYGLDRTCARELRAAGLVSAHISLDHHVAAEHDRIRGQDGAFGVALGAISASLDAGLYTAIQCVVEPALLRAGEMERFLEFCLGLGAQEVILLEPVPVRCGAFCSTFDATTRESLVELHRRALKDRRLPKVTAAPYLEGPSFLGCQAGFTFLYVAASGEVYPCDLAPASFGNIFDSGCDSVLDRLAKHFRFPAASCIGIGMRERMGPDRRFPVPWPESIEVLPINPRPNADTPMGTFLSAL